MSEKKQAELDERLMVEAERIIRKADEENIILRLMGAIAFRLHCPKYICYLDTLDRRLTDIDFASYSSERSKVESLLERLGYTSQSYFHVATSFLGRSIYWKKDDKEIKVDIFWDKLLMCHEISFLNRLHLDKPTIPLSELLQEKLQIVKLNLKDVKDTIVLLLEHDVAEKSTDKEIIDLSVILEKISKDWGCYYTFSMNLKKIQDILHELDALSSEEKSIVNERITRILDAFEKVPKTTSWKLRAKIGTKKKWYNEVE
jgi:hypothetical protein